MIKQSPVIEWHIAENDEEWARLCARPGPDNAPAVQRDWFFKPSLGRMIVILVLIGAGGWLWHKDQRALQTIEMELNATAQGESLAVALDQPQLTASLTDDQAPKAWQDQFVHEYGVLSSATAEAEGELGLKVDILLQSVDFHYDQAVATVILRTKAGEPTHRQTRFYRRTAIDWVRTAPDLELWGVEEQLETAFFVFTYRATDAAAVAAVAPQVDALYTTMRRNLGLSTAPGTEKLPITISVTDVPANSGYLSYPMAISVPSPALYLAPVELSEKEILAQSLALPLLNHLIGQTIEHYKLDSSWQPLLYGVRLWQVWESDLPLAAWRPTVVQWIYQDLPLADQQQTSVLPKQYTELCAAHTLWMPAPVQIQIPLWCQPLESGDWYAEQWKLLAPPVHLVDLGLPVPTGDVVYQNGPIGPSYHPGRTVAMATMLEYSVMTYGHERLPDLLAGLGQYKSWETLIPATFGVSAAEFEAGWQAYLATHYGIVTAPQ